MWQQWLEGTCMAWVEGLQVWSCEGVALSRTWRRERLGASGALLAQLCPGGSAGVCAGMGDSVVGPGGLW